MTFFYIIVGFVVLQRLLEVAYARSNERFMKKQGAIEAGAAHYKWIVLLHVLFFVSLTVEVFYTGGNLGEAWPIFLLIFILAQILRVWALASLGRFWNTKILVLPGAKKSQKRPLPLASASQLYRSGIGNRFASAGIRGLADSRRLHGRQRFASFTGPDPC